MPRGRLVTPTDDAEAIRLFTENNIVQIRRGTSGRILEVDHVEFGWMKPETYYRLGKLKSLQPLLVPVIEGGYRFKSALWRLQLDVDVFGTGVSVPLAFAFVGAAGGLHLMHSAAGRPLEAMLDILALFLPFGELWYFYLGAIALPEVLAVVQGAVDEVGETVADAQQALQDILSGKTPQLPGGPLPPV